MKEIANTVASILVFSLFGLVMGYLMVTGFAHYGDAKDGFTVFILGAMYFLGWVFGGVGVLGAFGLLAIAGMGVFGFIADQRLAVSERREQNAHIG